MDQNTPQNPPQPHAESARVRASRLSEGGAGLDGAEDGGGAVQAPQVPLLAARSGGMQGRRGFRFLFGLRRPEKPRKKIAFEQHVARIGPLSRVEEEAECVFK